MRTHSDASWEPLPVRERLIIEWRESMTDEELIKAMASGDRGAVADLYRRHGPWIAARLAGSTSSPELAEEALQDTFVVAWRSAAKYRAKVRLLLGYGESRGAVLLVWLVESIMPFCVCGSPTSIRRNSLRRRMTRRPEFARRPRNSHPSSDAPSRPSSLMIARSGRSPQRRALPRGRSRAACSAHVCACAES